MLFLFVEGPDDERLIRFLLSDTSEVNIYPYDMRAKSLIFTFNFGHLGIKNRPINFWDVVTTIFA